MKPLAWAAFDPWMVLYMHVCVGGDHGPSTTWNVGRYLSSALTAPNNIGRYNPVSRFLCLPELEDAEKRYRRFECSGAASEGGRAGPPCHVDFTPAEWQDAPTMKFNGLLKRPRPEQRSLGLQKGVSGLFQMPPSTTEV